MFSCSVPEIGFAQIGRSKSEVLRLPKVIHTYSHDGQSDFESDRIAASASDPITKTYHVFRDRVGAISLEWQNKLTLDEALGKLNQVTGLPPLQLPPQKAKWEIDRQQLDVFPPLGVVDDVRVPVAAAQELALRCPDGDMCRSLLNGIKLNPVEVTIRRAEMLDAYGSLR